MSRNFALVVTILVLASAQAFHSVQAAEVVELTDENFDAMTSEGKWIVEFFAPWCGHCQHLAPVFEEAARRINREHGGKIRLASVDCTVHSNVAGRFGIRGYPTLKYLRGGITTDYTGERTVDSFVAFANRVTGNPVTRVSVSDIGTIRRQNPVAFVLHSTSSRIIDLFTRVASKYQDLLRFAATDDREVVTQFADAKSRDAVDVLFLFNDDDEAVSYTGPWDESSVEKFITAHQLPIVSEITGTSWESIKLPGFPIVVIAIDPKKEQDLVRTAFRPVAKKMVGKFVFGWIDGTNQRYKYFLNDHNLTPERMPDFAVIDEKNNRFWEDVNVDQTSSASVEAFLTAIAEGKVDAQGPGASTIGHILAVLRNLVREVSNSYAMMAVAGILILVLFLTIWMVCVGGDGDEELEAMIQEAAEIKEKEKEKEKAKKDQ